MKQALIGSVLSFWMKYSVTPVPGKGSWVRWPVRRLWVISPGTSVSLIHYQLLASLASQYPGTFQNLHVSADIGARGTLHYDYVLKPGFSTQNVAFDILREEGIEQDFLDRIEALSPTEQAKDK